MNAASQKFSFHYISGQGANLSMKSTMLFAREKGEGEVAFSKLDIPRLVIWRPGWIKPLQQKKHPNFSLKMANWVGSLIYPMYSNFGCDGAEASKAFFWDIQQD
jgi:hypothetical protein